MVEKEMEREGGQYVGALYYVDELHGHWIGKTRSLHLSHCLQLTDFKNQLNLSEPQIFSFTRGILTAVMSQDCFEDYMR